MGHGDFYDGRRRDVSAALRVKPGRKMAVRLGLTQNRVRLPARSFTARIWQARVDYAFSPALTLNSFLQHDNLSRLAGLNARLRWTPRQGNDVFLVLNLGRQEDEEGHWVRAYDQVTAKAQYILRF